MKTIYEAPVLEITAFEAEEDVTILSAIATDSGKDNEIGDIWD